MLADTGEILLPPGSRLEIWKRMHGTVRLEIEDYFPSVVKQVANRLERRGLVKKMETKDGLVFEITDRGKKEVLRYRLGEMKQKRGKWDGLWRLVFFDIPEKNKGKRDNLRKFLKTLGMEQMQESVFVSPYDISGEVKYLREILEIPHGVKLGVLQKIEDEEELKEIFSL